MELLWSSNRESEQDQTDREADDGRDKAEE
jgi:hypothetical protein